MNQTEYKIRNLESQILYLQKEHATTLQMLHSEIKDLQMKNSEASFQLTMINVAGKASEVSSSSNSIDSERGHDTLVTQVTDLKTEMSSLNGQLASKIEQLEQYERKIGQLTETIFKLRECHRTELQSMEAELSAKSSEIALLSARLLGLHRTTEFPGDTDDSPVASTKGSLVRQSPIAPKTLKLRHQIAVHPDNVHLRRRPIIARQTVVSPPLPGHKGRVSFPEYALSVEDRAIFSKSIRRPSILPPINSVRNLSLGDLRSPSLTNLSDSSANLSSSPPTHIDVDEIIDLATKCQPIKYSVTKNS